MHNIYNLKSRLCCEIFNNENFTEFNSKAIKEAAINIQIDYNIA